MADNSNQQSQYQEMNKLFLKGREIWHIGNQADDDPYKSDTAIKRNKQA